MSTQREHDGTEGTQSEPREPVRSYLRRASTAIGFGLLLYVLAYAFVESATLRTGMRNPFHEIATQPARQDVVLVLGASHALPLEYQDMRAEVEERLGRPVRVLATPGGGVLPNAVILDYYLREHGTDHLGAVAYLVDSFAFYDDEWNEVRLEDQALWQKAPLDPQLIVALSRSVAAHDVAPSVLFAYVSGFSKLNDPTGWLREDRWDDEDAFDDRYQPSAVQDGARIDFLYPGEIEQATFDRYAGIFAGLLERLEADGVDVLAIKPPLRDDFRERLPQEDAFDTRIRSLVEAHGAAWHDLADLGYGAELYYDPDHLNREGVRRFLDDALVDLLAGG